MNLPNTLTLLRIFFVPLLVVVLVREGAVWDAAGVRFSNHMLALTIFVVAALTDLLDGYLARRWGQITTVGTLLDPIADKLLVSAALISLVEVRRLPAWIAVLLVGREFAVSGLRSIAAAEGYTIQASDLGKTKMVAQVAAIVLLLASGEWPGVGALATGVLWAVMAFSLWSALDYFRKFWGKIDEGVKLRRRRELLTLERRRRKADRAALRASVAKAKG